MKEPVGITLHWAIGLPLVTGLIAWALLNSTPWWLQLILAIASLALLGYLFQISGKWIFGPILMYELVRQTRSARVPALRTGYGLLLLLTMFLVFLAYTPGSGTERIATALEHGATIEPKDRARFAEAFFYAFLALQATMLYLFTPAMIIGSIAADRQRRSLDLLLTTELTSREIILGKLASRLAYLFLLLLTGLPILSFLQLLGGIDPRLVFGAVGAMALGVVTLASISMVLGVVTPRVPGALQFAYMLSLGHGLVFGFHTAMLLEEIAHGPLQTPTYGLIGLAVVYNCGLSGLCLYGSITDLRPQVGKGAGGPPAREAQTPQPSGDVRPPLGDLDPMWWKELYGERQFKDGKPHNGCWLFWAAGPCSRSV